MGAEVAAVAVGEEVGDEVGDVVVGELVGNTIEVTSGSHTMLLVKAVVAM